MRVPLGRLSHPPHSTIRHQSILLHPSFPGYTGRQELAGKRVPRVRQASRVRQVLRVPQVQQVPPVHQSHMRLR